MTDVAPILLLGLSGLLVGGAWSLRQQGASGLVIGVVAVCAILAGAAGVFYLLPEGAS